MSASDYLADVQRYDFHATADQVQMIVRHLAIGLRRDAALVACEDPAELRRIRESWCMKKLGAEPQAGDAAIERVCKLMARDRAKQRVTFYYLVAKALGKLTAL
jgi:Protein of unknown function (DUF2853)